MEDHFPSKTSGWESQTVITRIEIGMLNSVIDPMGNDLCESAEKVFGLPLEGARTATVFKIKADLASGEAERIRDELVDPVTQDAALDRRDPGPFDWAVTVGFKPGVTDNVGRTALVAAEDILGRSLGADADVFTERVFFLTAKGLGKEDVKKVALGIVANPLIHTVRVESRQEWESAGPDFSLPVMERSGGAKVAVVDLAGSDSDLERISREGILSLSVEEMRAIRDHFKGASYLEERRQLGLEASPTDAELEALAQTWSEHCKHKIFNAVIRYSEPGRPEETIRSIFKTYIKAATEEIGKRSDLLVSVFHDNAGVVRFNERWNVVYKVETHNSPSALDPYGGAITGIVGVNRDPFGTGRGAALLANVWGYCLGSPFFEKPIPEGLLHPRRIRDGVHHGVIDGGNQSGIPYARGFEWFDERYVGKPLVYCGTLGLMPHEVCGEPAHVKKVKPGDRIVMAGGRVGKDGIHGATFSSEELRAESPSQAVQIGDAFTQKKMTDFLLEARDLGLYTSITDNGAGGLSSSVGEMGCLSGGCDMDLKRAPLKYAGLQPWEILLSEAQERMTMAVPPDRIDAFLELAAARDVEAVDLGEFTDTGRFHVRYGDRTVAYIDMEFLHEGCPLMELEAEWNPPAREKPLLGKSGRLGADLKDLIRRLNVCSREKKSRQYDHEVKALSVVKPFVGRKRDIPSDATVMMVEPGSREGVVLAEGINPRLSDVDTYAMAASVVDLAMRRIVAAGGEPGSVAGLDNFCWPDPVQSEKTPDGKHKLAQLVRACRGLSDTTRAFGVPCISGKDSMKNDSVRGGVKISIPPTLLFSAVGKIIDVSCAVTPEFKRPGDLVYVLGVTRNELGGSEYLAMIGARDGRETIREGKPPRVEPRSALLLYCALNGAIRERLVRSVHTPALGGLAVGFALGGMGGELGVEVDLGRVPREKVDGDAALLFSETNSRFIVTVAPDRQERFEEMMGGTAFAAVGEVVAGCRIQATGLEGDRVLDCDVLELKRAWKKVLEEV